MSAETDAIIKYLRDSGVPFQVTSINTGGHAKGSFHFKMGTGGKGLAVDFDDFSTPQTNTPGLDAIWEAFTLVEGQLAELGYTGAPYGIKFGKRVAPYDKDNHVHVAVPRGTILVWPGRAPAPTPPPAPSGDWTKEAVMALPTLKQGDNGHHVKILQALLTVHAAGTMPNGFVDGDFGPTTFRVLRDWQARTGKLAADGICGQATWTWLIGA